MKKYVVIGDSIDGYFVMSNVSFKNRGNFKKRKDALAHAEKLEKSDMVEKFEFDSVFVDPPKNLNEIIKVK